MNSSRLVSRRATRLSVLLCAACLTSSATAQELEPARGPDAASILSDPIELLIGPSLGKVSYDGKVFYRYTHASGVPSAPGIQRSTDMHSVTASIAVDAGASFSASYAISGMMFSSNAFDDTVAHNVGLVVRRPIGDWNASLSHRYAHASTPLLETGQQTRQDLNTTALRLDRRLGQKTRLQLGFTQGVRATDSFSDYVTWSMDDWLHYLVSSVITTSVGYSYGYTKVDQSPDMDYHQLRGRIRWQLSEKLKFDLRAGVEKRRVVNAPTPDSDTPIFGAAVIYSPGETTTITLVSDRSVSPSYFRSQTTRNTDWRINVHQRLLEYLRLNVGYARNTSTFRGTMGGIGVSREDNGETYDASLSTQLAWGGAISVYYRHYDNESTIGTYGVAGHMIGAELSYGF